jgi:hypothetical protein
MVTCPNIGCITNYYTRFQTILLLGDHSKLLNFGKINRLYDYECCRQTD